MRMAILLPFAISLVFFEKEGCADEFIRASRKKGVALGDTGGMSRNLLPELDYLGSDPCSSNPSCLQECEGDCDTDADCADDLRCWNRDNEENEIPPTCNQLSSLIPEGTTRDSVDYCYACPSGETCLKYDGGNCYDSSSLCGECEGDCDDDENCAGGPAFQCFKKSSSSNDDNKVPNCTGSDNGSADYCYNKCPNPGEFCSIGSDACTNSKNGGQGPCTAACQGDCDEDEDCEGDLVCFQSENGPPPQCSGGEFKDGWDYCGSLSTPSPTVSPTVSPTMPPTMSPTVPPKFTSGNTYPAINGQTEKLYLQSGDTSFPDVVCGAVQSVLPHPDDPNICFAAGVNSGVWRTTDCTNDLPDWKPLTDDEEALSVGDMVFDHSDTTYQTILVGIGRRSSFRRVGHPGIGFLYTQNALSDEPVWQVLDNADGTVNFRTNQVVFNSVFVRGDLMMGTAYDSDPSACPNDYLGIWRSTNAGQTWNLVFQGAGRAIAADPNDDSRFYAVLDFTNQCAGTAQVNGILTSDDYGETWDFTTDDTPSNGIAEGELNNAKLSVSADGSRVWSALLRDGQDATISYSDDHGDSWTLMERITIPGEDSDDGLNPRQKPGGQGSIHFSLLANFRNKYEIFVGGDRQEENIDGNFPSFVGATDFSGALYRGDATMLETAEIPSVQWEHMTASRFIEEIPGGGTGASTSLDSDGSAPHADSRDMEFRADGVILEGNDGGVAIRTSPEYNTGDWFGVCGNMQNFEVNNIAYEPVLGTVLFGNQDTGTIWGNLGMPNTFKSLRTADGNACMIDYTTDVGNNNIFLYYGFQFYNPIFRATVNIVTEAVTEEFLFLPGDGGFVTVTAMNPADQSVFLVALENPTNEIIITEDRGDNFMTVIATGLVNAMAWSNDGSVFYYVDNVDDVWACDYDPPNPIVCVFMGTIGIPATHIVNRVVVDPTDVETIYAVSTNNFLFPNVWQSLDGGISWTDITVAGSLVDTAALGGALAVIETGGGNVVAVGTSNGILITDGGPGVGWKVLATGVPSVPITSMVYEPTDDRLVVGTFGRGIWFLEDASLEVTNAGGGRRRRRAEPVHSVMAFKFTGPDDEVKIPPDDPGDDFSSPTPNTS